MRGSFARAAWLARWHSSIFSVSLAASGAGRDSTKGAFAFVAANAKGFPPASLAAIVAATRAASRRPAMPNSSA